MRQTSPYRLTLLVCLAEIFGLASIAVFPALLPTFQTEWRLSHTAAGWISADFHSHSSPSGDNTGSQRGRVLNIFSLFW